MKTLLFDFETIGDKSVIPILPEPEPDSRLKDPKKIKKDIEAKRAKQIEMLGVDPKTNLICCASFCNYEKRKIESVLLDDAGEYALLQRCWNIIESYDRFVTFNGNSFDVECLNFHSAVHNIKIPVKLSQNNYRPGNHVDLRMVFANGNSRAKGTFDFFCKRFGFEGKDGVDGSMVQGMWDAGEFEKIREYCESDVKNLYRLYRRMVDTKYI